MTVRDWLDRARKEKFAIGAFNVGNLETLEAIVAAAINKKSPVLVESSSGETKYMQPHNLVELVQGYRERENIPIFLNLDHSPSLEEARVGIEAGFDLIHFDGSKMPYEENLETMKTVVKEAKERMLMTEGELENITGSSEVHKGAPPKLIYGNPDNDKKFVAETGVDTFAVSVGNVHGMYDKPKRLNFELLGKLRQVMDCHFSLHGSSGISDDQIKKAIPFGIVKININTEMRRAYRETLEKVLRENPGEYALYKIMPPVIEAVQSVVEKKMDIFGSSGKTS